MGPDKTEESRDCSPRRSYRAEGATEEPGTAFVTVEQDADVGVQTVQAALRIYGRYARWCLFTGYAHFLPIMETLLARVLVRSSDLPSRRLVSLLRRTFTLSIHQPPMHTSLSRLLASESIAS